MAYHRETADRLRRLFANRPDVSEKRMVGGVSFNAAGHMFCGATSGGLMIRVGPDALERTLREPHVRPMVFGRRRLSGFVVIDPAGYPTEEALSRWVARALGPA